MKTFIVLTLIALTAAEWTLKPKVEFMKIRSDCLQRYPENLKSRYEKYSPQTVQAIVCLLRGLGIWNDSDGFSVDRIMIGLQSAKSNIINYDEKLLREGLVRCSDKNTVGSSPFDWAHRCFRCFMANQYLYDSLRKATFYQEFQGEHHDE